MFMEMTVMVSQAVMDGGGFLHSDDKHLPLWIYPENSFLVAR